MNDWLPCIICYVDMIGLSKLALESLNIATKKMRDFHSLASQYILKMNHHDHVYVWNDSAAFVSHPKQNEDDYRFVIQELIDFTNETQNIASCYAVCVKGTSFPPPPPKPRCLPKYSFLTVSSWALANCFKIEKELGKYRKLFYIDGRIIRQGAMRPGDEISDMTMLPKYYKRAVHMYNRAPI